VEKTVKLYRMVIPHEHLMPATLRAIVEEFVTRDGTDHSSVDGRVNEVLSQLETGSVQLYFDEDTGSCNIVPKLDS
jgi:uncharacterized protein